MHHHFARYYPLHPLYPPYHRQHRFSILSTPRPSPVHIVLLDDLVVLRDLP